MEVQLVELLVNKSRFRSLLKVPFHTTQTRKWVLLQEICLTIVNRSGHTANEKWVEAAIAGGSLHRRVEDGYLLPTASWAPALADPVERKVKSLQKTYESHREKIAHWSSFDEVPAGLREYLKSLSPFHFHFESIFKFSIQLRGDQSTVTPVSAAPSVTADVAHGITGAIGQATVGGVGLYTTEERAPTAKATTRIDTATWPVSLSTPQYANAHFYAAIANTQCDTFDPLSKACKRELFDATDFKLPHVADKNPPSGDGTEQVDQALKKTQMVIDLTMDSDSETEESIASRPEDGHILTLGDAFPTRRFTDLASLSPTPGLPEPPFPPPLPLLEDTAEAIVDLPVRDFAPELHLPESLDSIEVGIPWTQPSWKTSSSPVCPPIILSPDSTVEDLPESYEDVLYPLESTEGVAELEEIDELDESEDETEVVVKLEPPDLPKEVEDRHSSESSKSVGALRLLIEQPEPRPSPAVIDQQIVVSSAAVANEPKTDVTDSSGRKRRNSVQVIRPKRSRLMIEVEVPPVVNRHLYTTFRIADKHEKETSLKLATNAAAEGSAAANTVSKGPAEVVVAFVQEDAPTGHARPTAQSRYANGLSLHATDYSCSEKPEAETPSETELQDRQPVVAPVLSNESKQPSSPASRPHAPSRISAGRPQSILSDGRDNEGKPYAPKIVRFDIPSPTIVKLELVDKESITSVEMLRRAKSAAFQRSWLRELSTKTSSSKRLRRKIEKERCRLFAYALTDILSSTPVTCLNNWSVMIEPEALTSKVMGKRARMIAKLVELAGGTRAETHAELVQWHKPSKRLVVGFSEHQVNYDSTILHGHQPAVWQYKSILDFLRFLDLAYHRALAKLAEHPAYDRRSVSTSAGIATQPNGCLAHKMAISGPQTNPGPRPQRTRSGTGTGASIDVLRHRPSRSYPSFPSGAGLHDGGIPMFAHTARLPAGDIARLLRMGRSECMNGDWDLKDMLAYERENVKGIQHGEAFLESKRADCLSRAYLELQGAWTDNTDILRNCHFMQLIGDDVAHISRKSKLSSLIRNAGGYHSERVGFANAGPHIARQVVVPSRGILLSRKHLIAAESQDARMISELDLLLLIDQRYRERKLIPLEIERRT
ncbi:hypothetical protein IAU59_000282 [Kwoniella sp. CBS 9459]